MFNFDLAFNIIVTISAVMLGFAIVVLWWYILYFFMASKKIDVIPHNNEYSKFAVLVPARDESKVISRLLESFKRQTYPAQYFDVWVVVEDENDPTVQIVKDFGYHYFVRDRLTPDRQTKGFALQEITDYLKRENYHYDAYMIFDADNYLDDNYIEIMNDVRGAKVKVGVGYRNFSNANTNWLTCCSAAMFAYMNQVTSRGRSYLFHKATLMGTGYYVDCDIIDDAGGWKFTGMTEDVQLTAYCYYHDVYMHYYPLACFYDEQSSKYKDVHKQHVRWLQGYFQRRHFLKTFGVHYQYHTKAEIRLMRYEFRAGLIPFIIYNVINALLFLLSFALAIAAAVMLNNVGFTWKAFGLTLYQFLILYVPFVIASSFIMLKDKKHLKFKFRTRLWCALTYFFFFYDFLFAFFECIFTPKKKVKWEKIEHTGKEDKD